MVEVVAMFRCFPCFHPNLFRSFSKVRAPSTSHVARRGDAGEPRADSRGGFDAYLLLEVTGHYRDDDLALLLTYAAAGLSKSGRLIVVERLSDDGAITEDQAEFDLLMLCMHGSGVRTRAEFESVATAAGLVVTASRLVGWGIAVLDLQPAPEAVVPQR